MYWTTEEPTQTGIYLAMDKETGEIVGAAVKAFTYSPGNDLPPGVYCHGYIGLKAGKRAGNPQGVPMSDWFSSWTLVMPVRDPDQQKS